MGAQITTPPYTYTKDLGAWVARTEATVYQAATDGFCVGFNTAGVGNDVVARTDGSNPPTTERAHNASATRVAGVCCPVKAFDYWKITGADGGVWWIPLEP